MLVQCHTQPDRFVDFLEDRNVVGNAIKHTPRLDTSYKQMSERVSERVSKSLSE